MTLVGVKRNVPMPGDEVRLWGSDHNFHGIVLAVVLRHYSTGWKVVVENKDGIIELFDPKQLIRLKHREHETLFERYDE